MFLGAASLSALTQSQACGYEPDDRKGEGEPCTRSDECEIGLECRGGVCMIEGADAGPGIDGGFDAGVASRDAGQPDTGVAADAGRDAAIDAAP